MFFLRPGFGKICLLRLLVPQRALNVGPRFAAVFSQCAVYVGDGIVADDIHLRRQRHRLHPHRVTLGPEHQPGDPAVPDDPAEQLPGFIDGPGGAYTYDVRTQTSY